jgi:hypothetical protein
MRIWTLWMAAAALALAGCVPTDVTGCPLEPSEAIGMPCAEGGMQCGEFSLCDPCGDTSACELIECTSAGTWQTVELEACSDGGR